MSHYKCTLGFISSKDKRFHVGDMISPAGYNTLLSREKDNFRYYEGDDDVVDRLIDVATNVVLGAAIDEIFNTDSDSNSSSSPDSSSSDFGGFGGGDFGGGGAGGDF